MPIRLSSLFLRTLREDPADAEVTSHKLLVRAGYIRRAAPGVYTWLPLGLAVKSKIENVVREEMNAAGAVELTMPVVQPAGGVTYANKSDKAEARLKRLFKRLHKTSNWAAPRSQSLFSRPRLRKLAFRDALEHGDV